MINLRISEEQFNELYPDLVGYYSHFDNPPPPGISAREFELKYLSSKLWRLNNIYTVTNKDGELVTFRMNYAQHKVYAASRKHPRIIILKSRQQGISTFWLVSYFDDAIVCPYLSLGLMAQGKDEASTLLDRVKILWDKLDDSIKAYFGIELDKDNATAIEFSNHSKMFIRVSFRSATLQRLHISEFGKIANKYPQRATETKTGTLQALGKGNTGVVESTAEGKNDFSIMWDNAVAVDSAGTRSEKDFLPVFLSWLEDPDCALDTYQEVSLEHAEYFLKLEKETGRKLTREQKNFWIAQERELGGDVYQEYPGTPAEAFTASKDGTYFAKLYNQTVVAKKRIVKDLFDPNLPLDIYLDLGVGDEDYFVMGFSQWRDGQVRLVDEYWNNGYGLEHYLLEAHDRYRHKIRAFIMPHDGKKRQLGNSDDRGKAKELDRVAREIIKKYDIRAKVYRQKKRAIRVGIQAVRSMLPNLWIDEQCTYIQDCLLNYSKEWDPKLKTWKKTPFHDEYSHGADMLRGMAIGIIESPEMHESKYASKQPTKPFKGHAL